MYKQKYKKRNNKAWTQLQKFQPQNISNKKATFPPHQKKQKKKQKNINSLFWRVEK